MKAIPGLIRIPGTLRLFCPLWDPEAGSHSICQMRRRPWSLFTLDGQGNNIRKKHPAGPGSQDGVKGLQTTGGSVANTANY